MKIFFVKIKFSIDYEGSDDWFSVAFENKNHAEQLLNNIKMSTRALNFWTGVKRPKNDFRLARYIDLRHAFAFQKLAQLLSENFLETRPMRRTDVTALACLVNGGGFGPSCRFHSEMIELYVSKVCLTGD